MTGLQTCIRALPGGLAAAALAAGRATGPHRSVCTRGAAALLTALLAACGGDAVPSADAGEAGRLVIVGGALAEENAPVYHAVLGALEGPGPLCVLPTASGAPEESMRTAVERFAAYAEARAEGSEARAVVGLWITADNADAASDPGMVGRLSGCGGYWFVGGSQSRIVRAFRPGGGITPAYEALMMRWREGAVVAGTSAGAAMMSSASIAGGSSGDALAHGVARDADGDGEPDGPGVWIMDGMGFVPWAIVGQHHLARGRWGRLVAAAIEERRLALGIDENTALVVDGGTARVIGASSVLVVDPSAATRGTDPVTASGVRLELLGPGDRLDIVSRDVVRPTEGRAALRPDPAPASGTAEAEGPDGRPSPGAIPADPFERWAFLRVLHGFAVGELDAVTLDGGARLLGLRAAPDFRAYLPEDAAELPEPGLPGGLSAGPLLLDVVVPGR